MSKKIAFRVDTNEIIATGHVMRCISVAKALRKAGEQPVFVSSDDNILPFTEKEGLETHIIGSDWKDKESETEKLIGFLSSEGIDVIFVDSYSVTGGYFRKLKNAGMHVFYIDDLCETGYPVDALVNYCPAAPGLGYEKLYGEETKLYLGPAYIPLREQFGLGYVSEGDGIFITAGGSDSLGLTDTIIRGIVNEGLTDADSNTLTGRYSMIHLLAGRYYHPTEFIKQAVNEGQVVLHQNVDNVAEIMSKCKAAVSSAGTTLFELSAVGVITTSFVFADNQMTDALYFEEAQLMPYAGDFRKDPDACMERIISFLYEIKDISGEEKQRRSRELSSIIDGQGAKRLSDILISMNH